MVALSFKVLVVLPSLGSKLSVKLSNCAEGVRWSWFGVTKEVQYGCCPPYWWKRAEKEVNSCTRKPRNNVANWEPLIRFTCDNMSFFTLRIHSTQRLVALLSACWCGRTSHRRTFSDLQRAVRPKQAILLHMQATCLETSFVNTCWIGKQKSIPLQRFTTGRFQALFTLLLPRNRCFHQSLQQLCSNMLTTQPASCPHTHLWWVIISTPYVVDCGCEVFNHKSNSVHFGMYKGRRNIRRLRCNWRSFQSLHT